MGRGWGHGHRKRHEEKMSVWSHEMVDNTCNFLSFKWQRSPRIFFTQSSGRSFFLTTVSEATLKPGWFNFLPLNKTN